MTTTRRKAQFRAELAERRERVGGDQALVEAADKMELLRNNLNDLFNVLSTNPEAWEKVTQAYDIARQIQHEAATYQRAALVARDVAVEMERQRDFIIKDMLRDDKVRQLEREKRVAVTVAQRLGMPVGDVEKVFAALLRGNERDLPFTAENILVEALYQVAAMIEDQ